MARTLICIDHAEAKSLYTQEELDARQKIYFAAGRSLSGQSVGYYAFLYETARYDSERDYLKTVIERLSEIYFQPH